MKTFAQWLELREAWNQKTVWTPDRVAQQSGSSQPGNVGGFGQYRPRFPESAQKVDVVAQIVANHTGVPLRALMGSRMHGTREARWLLYALLLDGAGLAPHKIKSMMNQKIMVPANLNAARANIAYPQLLSQVQQALAGGGEEEQPGASLPRQAGPFTNVPEEPAAV